MPTGTAVTEEQARRVGKWPNVWYRTWPTKRDYSFTFSFVKGHWRIYVDNSPSYGRRPSGSIETHRLGIGTRAYICWDQPITSLSNAQAVAALWADSTERYIATGRFEPPPGRPSPNDRSVLNGFGTPTLQPRTGPVGTRRHALSWYEDDDHRRWIGGFTGLVVLSLSWICCMSNGFGFWDFIWLAATGACTLFTYIVVDNMLCTAGDLHNVIKSTIIAQAVTGAILGAANVWGAPGFLWAAWWLLIAANVIQFAASAIASVTREPGQAYPRMQSAYSFLLHHLGAKEAHTMKHTTNPTALVAETIPAGTFHGGEEIPAGTFHVSGVIQCSRCKRSIAASRFAQHLRTCGK